MAQKTKTTDTLAQIESLKAQIVELKAKAKAEMLAAVDPKDYKVIDYSDKAILVYGDGTRLHNGKLKEMSGRFGARFKVKDELVKGWILPKSRVGTVKDVKKALAK